ncbi:glycosyltransferase [Fictibacillus iocasae]|uniref:Glycosyltransferase n=1 Tax=Fictibacillus iocasae TaxID=2715437 RepID=A0ABW2NQV2_9BACL
MNPKVSIIIPFYNCSYVAHAINSALNQTYPNIEIIVVDDGSTRYVEHLDHFKDKIIYVRKDNGGTATALNLGIKNASGEYIAWLSSDDYFLPEKISKQLAFMQSNQADISYTNFDVVDKHNHLIHSAVSQKFSTIKELYETMTIGNPINGCTVMMRKTLFQKVGYFNPDLKFTQDYCMWFRVLFHGYHMYFLDEPLTKYRIHDESTTHNNLLQLNTEANYVISYYGSLLRDKFKE